MTLLGQMGDQPTCTMCDCVSEMHYTSILREWDTIRAGLHERGVEGVKIEVDLDGVAWCIHCESYCAGEYAVHEEVDADA